MEEDSIFRKIINFCTNRLLILLLVVLFGFFVLVVRLFELQIVQGESFLNEITASVFKEMDEEAPRGLIYDRFGRPLAENNVMFNLKVDTTIAMPDKQETLLQLITILDAHGEQIVDDLPISQEEPRTFLFNDSARREEIWKTEMQMKEKSLNMDMNAQDAYEYLKKELFKTPEGLPPETERKLLALNHLLYMNRLNVKPVSIAINIKDETVAAVEERRELFASVQVDVEAQRYYAGGNNFSHMIGYLGAINPDELELLESKGYQSNDVIGKIGIEKSMEDVLRGTDGKKQVEINSTGRVLDSEIIKEAIPGDKVFLTVDSHFQNSVARILETSLRDSIVSRIEGRISRGGVSQLDLTVGFIESNTISVSRIWNEGRGAQIQMQFRTIIADEFDKQQIELVAQMQEKEPEAVVEKAVFNPNNFEHIAAAKSILTKAAEDGKISLIQVLSVCFEQGVLNDPKDWEDLHKNRIGAIQFVKQKLISGELEPKDLGLEPLSGGVAVFDANTGEVLALVTYPTYDNNRYLNDMEYYRMINNDPTTPLVNRPMMTRKAPGSTFKMVMAIALLEENMITTKDTVNDLGVFTKAGIPYASCWISPQGGSHHSVNVTKAIEVSCNYFFFELSYRMGNSSAGTRLEGIQRLNKYMEAFGLNDYTGIEIEEYKPMIASPENKEAIVLERNPEASASDTRWTDGDTIRAAIGQSINNYAPAHMAKYIATLANGGTRHKNTIIMRQESYSGDRIIEMHPVIEEQLNIKQANLDAVYQGMRDVITGSNGTARYTFSQLPVAVAGKTGTAEEDKSKANHAWFVAYAPYDEPLIAVAVMIPYGEISSQPAAIVARDVIAEYMGLNITAEDNPMENMIAK